MEHPGQLCRLCAQACNFAETLFLFNEDEQNSYPGTEDDDEFSCMDIIELINISLPVKVSRTDHLPKQVCFQCVEKVKASSEFAAVCLAAEHQLQKLWEENKFLADKISVKNEDVLRPMMTDYELKAALEDTDIVDMKDSEDETNSADNYCCPLCCEGIMVQNINRSSMSKTQNDCEIVSDSDNSINVDVLESDLEDKNKYEDEEMEEDEVDKDYIPDGTETIDEDAEDIDDPSFIDDANDRDYTNSNNKKRKKIEINQSRGGGRGKPRGGKRGRLSRNSKASSRKGSGDDTLMWLEEESEHSLPLVQCNRCSGWLPGFGACLQHTLSSHVIVEGEKKKVECSRCELPPFESEKKLVHHFKTRHCVDLDITVADDGTYCILDKATVKGRGKRFRNMPFKCVLCGKGCSWLLNLLRHSCQASIDSPMHCNDCDLSFTNRQRFIFHKQFHGPTAPQLECDVCGEKVTSDSLLYDHVRFSHFEDNIVCDECGKEFRTDKGLHAHQQNTHCENPSTLNKHSCPECGKSYRDKQGLKEHMILHLTEKPFRCEKCPRAYNRYSRLKQHLRSHVYSDNMDCFECSSCGLAFPTAESAVYHSKVEDHDVQTVTLNKVYRCEYCDSLFSRADSLNKHRLVHEGVDKPYTCHICGAAFSSYSRVTTHKTTHGIYDQVEPKENDFIVPKHFLCEVCGFSYLYWSYLKTHRRMRHSDDPYTVQCKLCPEKFKNSWSALYHRKKVHVEGGVVKGSRMKPLTCKICGSSYMYQQSLDVHMERKHGSGGDERECYQCESCGKVFKYQSSLLIHKKLHDGQKSWWCDICNKDFLTIATLRNHMRRCHQNVRRHKCDYCDKTFFHKVSCDDHMRLHTGEKPFECEICHRSFRLKTMLTDHAKIHTDDRPYPCDICGISFRRMVHMKQHRMLHTGERPFECPMCHQDFRLKQELQRHLKSKHVEPELPDEEFILS